MRRAVREVQVAMRRPSSLVALLLAFVLGTPAQAAPAPPREARWAASWLAGRLGSAGYFRGLDGKPDLGTTVAAGLALAAAGALIGAVMKEMRGQADAGRVRELILEKLT